MRLLISPRSVPQILVAPFDEKLLSEAQNVAAVFPFQLTSYYASLIHSENFKNDPIFMQSFPSSSELLASSGDQSDPLHESLHQPVEGLLQKHLHRAVLLISNQCAVYCRHCTRKNRVGQSEGLSENAWQSIRAYLQLHPEINEIILSGGDPLWLSHKILLRYLSDLKNIPSITFIRIGSRVPVTAPESLSAHFVKQLTPFQPLWLGVQFNHPNEITEASTRAIRLFVDRGIPVYNQSVLLKGINNSVSVLVELCERLVRIGVKPYYLFRCDSTQGTRHFQTDPDEDLMLIQELGQRLSGLAMPIYVRDTAEGKSRAI